MKLKLLYLLLLLAFMSGCMGSKNSAPTPNNAPVGTFTGQFALLHKHSKTGVVDTSLANLVINMETSTGFKVTGDTSTVHAGSYGGFIVNSSYTAIDFLDQTYPTTGVPAKNHLNGVYQYSYDGTNLKISAYSAFDTLAYIYSLKKTGN